MASTSATMRWIISRLCVGFFREEKKVAKPSGNVSVVNVRP